MIPSRNSRINYTDYVLQALREDEERQAEAIRAFYKANPDPAPGMFLSASQAWKVLGFVAVSAFFGYLLAYWIITKVVDVALTALGQ